ncbi:MAG: DUF2073 domain-containing protein [Thermoplasmata archaeon]|nr:MAG: DUF2073 domain-containing protein [Thermoplasmata archaeon]KAA0015120.1 MAG: DUF2073 domain-containing protein [Thermoplasmata archaeon]
MEIKVNFIAYEKLNGLSMEEKLNFILKEVEKGQILVLEKGLTTEEQAKLIEMTMKDINDGFVGIEMESYMEERKSFWQKLFGKSRARMTVVGPADKLKTVYRDKDVIKAVIKAR